MYLDDEIALGPGKRQLLELVERHGSLSAAARAMGRSYRRAWLMVDTMNRCFQEPLVHAGKGGAHGGGTTLTPFGQAIRDRFAALEATLAATTAPDLAHLRQLLRWKEDPCGITRAGCARSQTGTCQPRHAATPSPPGRRQTPSAPR